LWCGAGSLAQASRSPWAVIVLSPGPLGSIIERPALHLRMQPGLIQAKRALCADGVQIGLSIKDGREAVRYDLHSLCGCHEKGVKCN